MKYKQMDQEFFNALSQREKEWRAKQIELMRAQYRRLDALLYAQAKNIRKQFAIVPTPRTYVE